MLLSGDVGTTAREDLVGKKTVLVAPSREDIPIAGSWRLFCQGDEFYAASQYAIQVSKISFHKNGKWQFQVGSMVQKLSAARMPLPGWRHAVSLHWLVWKGALSPNFIDDDRLVLIDVPEGQKLVINILQSAAPTDSDPPPPPEGGIYFWNETLRSGTKIVAHAVTIKQSEHDEAAALRLRREANITGDPPFLYGELAWFSVREESGNVVAIVPLGEDSFTIRNH